MFDRSNRSETVSVEITFTNGRPVERRIRIPPGRTLRGTERSFDLHRIRTDRRAANIRAKCALQCVTPLKLAPPLLRPDKPTPYRPRVARSQPRAPSNIVAFPIPASRRRYFPILSQPLCHRAPVSWVSRERPIGSVMNESMCIGFKAPLEAQSHSQSSASAGVLGDRPHRKGVGTQGVECCCGQA